MPPDDAGRVAVFGGTGFIGSVVVRRLAELGYHVRSVGRRPGTTTADRIESMTTDLTAPGRIERAVDGCDAVIHLAGYTAAAGRWRVGTDDDAARRVTIGTVVELITSLRTRSGSPPLLLHASSLAARWPDSGGYAAHKHRAEQAVAAAVASGSVRGASLRLPTVYGSGADQTRPWVDAGLVGTLSRRALAGEEVPLWCGGTVRRNLVEVNDVADAVAAALRETDRLRHPVYEVGGPQSVTVRRIAETAVGAAASITGRRSALIDVPAPSYATESDLRDIDVDAKTFRTATGWRPSVDPDRGIARVVEILAR